MRVRVFDYDMNKVPEGKSHIVSEKAGEEKKGKSGRECLHANVFVCL